MVEESGIGPGCGPGTEQVGDVCVPVSDGVKCGAGTKEVEGQCVPVATGGAGYTVLIGADEIPGDGFSKIPVVAYGTDEQGNILTDDVILTLSRGDAGSLSPSKLTMGPLGGTSFLTPCNSANSPTCIGTFNVALALASDPSTILVKSSDATIVAPDGVGSPAPCLSGGNVVFFDGDANDYIHSGTDTIKVGSWSASASQFKVAITMNPSDQSQGSWWDFTFSSEELNQPLGTQVYEGAERWPFQSPGKPGLSIDGDGKGCNTLTGRFQIHDLTLNGSTLTNFTATFEQHCEGGSAALRGCVHFEQ